jgi:hypothetical protein
VDTPELGRYRLLRQPHAQLIARFRSELFEQRQAEAYPTLVPPQKFRRFHLTHAVLEHQSINDPLPCDLSTEDNGDLVWLADGAVCVQQMFSHLVRRRAAAENEVIAQLDLSEKQTVLAASLFAFRFREEGSERGQSLLTAGQQVARGEGIGQFMQSGGVGASQKGIGALLKVDALFAHASCKPVMLIEADPR